MYELIDIDIQPIIIKSCTVGTLGRLKRNNDKRIALSMIPVAGKDRLYLLIVAMIQVTMYKAGVSPTTTSLCMRDRVFISSTSVGIKKSTTHAIIVIGSLLKNKRIAINKKAVRLSTTIENRIIYRTGDKSMNPKRSICIIDRTTTKQTVHI